MSEKDFQAEVMERFDKVDKRFDSVDDRLETIEDVLVNMAGDISKITATLDLASRISDTNIKKTVITALGTAWSVGSKAES